MNYNDRNRLGIYVHIPFCLSKCAYCDFNSAPAQSDEVITSYIDAVIAHMESYREAASSYEANTVFIGGGTPTCIPSGELCRLIRAIKKNFRLTKTAEFTVESNPATVTYASLRRLHRLGVNRLSMGLQSANDNELKALSRIHTRKDFAQSFRIAREAKFDNINVDLMFGIPHQTYDSLMHTIYYVSRLNPEHISLYDLKIEPGTWFYRNYEKIAPYLPGDDAEADMYLGAIAKLREYGYMQYEISNFAHPGHMCIHNFKYWNCEEYLGFGVSAHSYFNGNRFAFTPNLEKYIKGTTNLESNVNLTTECDEIGPRERVGEYIMLRLRLTAGIYENDFVRMFGKTFMSEYGQKCRKYIERGFMIYRKGNISLTPAGMFISNYILSDILDFEDLGRFDFN